MSPQEHEREKRQRAFQEWPPDLQALCRERQRELVAEGVPLDEARERTWWEFSRRAAWRRRGDDARDCKRCGDGPFLPRREGERFVQVTVTGEVHRC